MTAPTAPAPVAPVDPLVAPLAPAPVAVEPVIETPRVYTQAEIDEITRKQKEAETQAKAYEKKIQEFEDKDKTELERAQAEAERAKAETEQIKQELQQTRIQNKFLAVNKYSWHNPESALKLLDSSEIKISDTGEVSGLDKAIDNLAKTHPYLIKGEEKKDIKETKSSGNQPKAGGGAGDKDALDREKLTKKYAALRGRSDVGGY